jgi:hypothetical protein
VGVQMRLRALVRRTWPMCVRLCCLCAVVSETVWGLRLVREFETKYDFYRVISKVDGER